MSSTLLDISGRIDNGTIRIYQAVNEAVDELGLVYVVVGAAARDLVMHHGYGARIQRATMDMDFGLQVSDWGAFNTLTQKLREKGFTETRIQHRLESEDGMPIDIVPFGGVESDGANIDWPPKGDVRMSVLGFHEACANPKMVRISVDPDIDIPVATPEGLILLKLIAWTDRDKTKRVKDARDIKYLLESYELIPPVKEWLYGQSDLMGAYEWDIALGGAHKLGIEARLIASEKTVEAIDLLKEERSRRLHFDLLVEEMCRHPEMEFDRNLELFSAFLNGFYGES